MSETINLALLQRFLPFKVMSESGLGEIFLKARTIECSKGKMLFKRGESRTECHWLLAGTVDLVNADYQSLDLLADDEKNDRALEEAEIYHRTCVATSGCRLLVMSQDDLDLVLTVDQVAEHGQADDDWMTRLLQSRLFELIPPANIQKLFNEFSEVNYRRGDIVIHQGETDDFFYVVKHGAASIDREIRGEFRHLADIGPGSFFGEDALVRETPRNATVTMLTRGSLMRLNKHDFNQLMVRPVSAYVTREEIQRVIAGGEQSVNLIDVRHPNEIETESITGTINIPLQLLGGQTSTLNQESVYVVSTPGRRGELGAFVLNQAGFDTYILQH